MARYDSMRKLERNRAVREYRAAHPELSYAEIGKVFQIDQARVWRLCHNGKKKEMETPPC